MNGTTYSDAMDRAEFDRNVQVILQNIDQKLASLSKKLDILKHVLALYRYMIDPEVNWTKKALVVAALVYFIVPIDAIPDFSPIVGYLDDAAVVAAVVKTLGKGLAKYYEKDASEGLSTPT
jgi:uncharacterized membrane protein YkvA (DUF1232 family)